MLALLRALAVITRAAAVVAGSSSAAGTSTTIDGDTGWVIASTDPASGGLGGPLHLALRDLRKDWYSAFGAPPVTLGTMLPYTGFNTTFGPSHAAFPTWDAPPASDATGTFTSSSGSCSRSAAT